MFYLFVVIYVIVPGLLLLWGIVELRLLLATSPQKADGPSLGQPIEKGEQ